MTRKARSLILYVLVLLFFIVGAGAVFYAQGWRAKLDAQGPGPVFQKIGAIYLRTFPEDATITIDGKDQERSRGIFERGLLVGNLFPGTHEVRVKKDGYHDWAAKLEVGPSRVTSHPRVVLVPAAGTIATSTSLLDFQVFGDRLILETSTTLKDFAGDPISGKKVVAGTDDGRLLVTASSSVYLWHNLESSSSGTLATVFPKLGAPKSLAGSAIAAIPETQLFLVTSSSSIRILETRNGVVTTLTSTSSISIAGTALSASRIAWSEFDSKTNASRISLFDLLSGTPFRDIDALPQKTQKMAFADRNTVIVLQSDGSLYSVSLSEAGRIKIAHGAKDFALSSDKSKLAILEEDGLSIFGGSDGASYRFLKVEDAKEITRLAWYKDVTHLFLQKGATLFFLDLGDPTFANMTAVAETQHFEYLASSNDLYFLQNGKLVRVEFPD